MVEPPDTDETEVLGVGLTDDRGEAREIPFLGFLFRGEVTIAMFSDVCCGQSGMPQDPSRLMTQGGVEPPRQDRTKAA